MRRITKSSQRVDVCTRRHSIAIGLAGVLTCISLAAYAGERPSPAQSSQSIDARSPVSVLEREFWACDYAAATRGVTGSEAYMCSSNFEEFKRARFGGDFAAMLTWWQQHKAAAHRALAEGGGTIAAR